MDKFNCPEEDFNRMNDFLQNLRNGQAEKQRPQKTHRNRDNFYQYSNSRFHSYGGYQNTKNSQSMKRPSRQTHPGNQISGADNIGTSMLAEAIENLNIHIETLAKNQDYIIKIQEKTANMLERHVNAFERVLNHLNIEPAKEDSTQKKTAASQKNENNYVASLKSGHDESNPAKVSGQTSMKNIKHEKPVGRTRKKNAVKKSSVQVPTEGERIDRKAIIDIIHTMRSKEATFDQIADHLMELGYPTLSGRGEWHAQTVHRLCSKR